MGVRRVPIVEGIYATIKRGCCIRTNDEGRRIIVFEIVLFKVNVYDIPHVVWGNILFATSECTFPDHGHNMMLMYLHVQNGSKRFSLLPVPHTLPPCKRHDVFFQFRG